ncbi:MAG: 2-hydroxyglutaryl-CoA dehydratase [Myxococcota bacterium]
MTMPKPTHSPTHGLEERLDASPPLSQLDADMEAELRAFEEQERQRLGLTDTTQHWQDSMLNLKFRAGEKKKVTILIAALTVMQDSLMEAALKGLGYNVFYFGQQTNDGFRAGKEFGNKGQCNPTYFTVGHLVHFLCQLRDKHGLSTQEILENYVYLTAGACGPCRFGMYLTEYRKALRDAGFEGFRVIVYEQEGGLGQTMEDAGLPITPQFFWEVGKSVVCGDVLNALGYRIRPYEVTPGDTDRALESCKRLVYEALEHHTNILLALQKCREVLMKVPVNRLQPKAKVSIIGEFWAMTTEGDGNYGLQRFVEQEGGECDIQLTTAWILYTLWEFQRDTQVREALRGTDKGFRGLEGVEGFDHGKRMMAFKVAELALRSGFQTFANAAGLYDYHLPDMDQIAEVSADYYHNDLRGGEGHMEVGKFILNTLLLKAHMTLSVKPFGCMPSSGVSDGVQSVITQKLPGALFCAVETSGDGAANFYSRVQMFMYKARQVAEEELQATLKTEGITQEELEQFLKANPKYASPLYWPSHRVAGTAANLVHELAPFIKQSRMERVLHQVERGMRGLRETARLAPVQFQKLLAAREHAPELLLKLRTDAELAGALLVEQWPKLFSRTAPAQVDRSSSEAHPV